MLGLMQDWPLVCHKVIDHAATYHGTREVVSRSVEGPIHKTSYAEVRRNALRLAKRLAMDGVQLGDRVATMAWNTWRHLEAWYGIMGLGAVCHTINPRLFPDQIAWIVNDAEDKVLMCDLTFVPLIEKLAASLPTIERYVILTDAEHMPETSLPNAVAYEDWLAEADDDFAWAAFDENTAAGLCYTSGTTGHPKGVVYSHRSNVLHAFVAAPPDMLGIAAADAILPIVPMFHANGWSLALSAPMVGAAMIMPGAKLDGTSVYEMLTDQKVTFSAAVPTIWLMLLQHLEATGGTLPHLKRVVIGGAACPRVIIEAFETKYGVEVAHAWGMTEMSPIGTICSLKPPYDELEGEERFAIKDKQGYPPFGVELKITDDEGTPLPRDGKTFGRLKVRGPCIARAYFKREDESILDAEGYFDTGDVSTLDPYGYMQITDRSKDVIKSGGEWISSIELENLAVGHPKIAEAAAIGVAHPKWGERPLLVVVLKKGESAEKAEILEFMRDKVATWWLPDDIAIVEEIPHTATGKIRKTALRDEFKGYELQTDTTGE